MHGTKWFFAMTLAVTCCGYVYAQTLDDYYKDGVRKFSASDYRGALEAWQRGLVLAKEQGNKLASGTMLVNMGTAYDNLEEYEKALGNYVEAQDVFRILKERKRERDVDVKIGLVWIEMDNDRKALDSYRHALEIDRELGDIQGEKSDLIAVGIVYERQKDSANAVKSLQQALAIALKTGDRKDEGEILHTIGRVYRESGDATRTLENYQQAVQIFRDIGDREAEGSSLLDIGIVYGNLPDHLKALDYFQQALKIYGDIGDRAAERIVLGNILCVYLTIEDYSNAMPNLRKTLEIDRESKNRPGEADDLWSMGRIYAQSGEYSKARESILQSMEIAIQLKDRKREASAFFTLGIICRQLGDYRHALEYDQRALQIDRETGNRQGEAGDLCNIGVLYGTLGDYPVALKNYEQALLISRETGDMGGESVTLINIGTIHRYETGGLAAAAQCFQRALDIAVKAGIPTDKAEINLAETYLEQEKISEAYVIFKRLGSFSGLGLYHLKVRDYKTAQTDFAQLLMLENKREISNFETLLGCEIGIGLSFEGSEQYVAARIWFQKGIDLIEAQRSRLGSWGKETFFGAKVLGFSILEPYNGMVRVLFKEKGVGYEKKSFEYAERAKSRSFVEELSVQGIPSNPDYRSFREKEQQLLVLKKRTDAEAQRLLGRPNAPQREKDQMAKDRQDLTKKENEYRVFLEGLRTKDPELASLVAYVPVTAESIQSLLDEKTTLLEYFSTPEALYAWVVTKTGVTAYELPMGEQKLQTTVNDLLLPNITTRSARTAPAILLNRSSDVRGEETTKEKREENRIKFLDICKGLYAQLVAPVAKDITTSHLIIVPHGVLHKVPFGAFNDGKEYLVDKYTLSFLPSGGVMEYVTQKRKPNQGTISIFANPDIPPMVSARPLPAAEQEGEDIAKMFPRTKCSLLKTAKATETVVRNITENADILHFACHGLFDDTQPLQSALVLARDEKNDGILYVDEIFGLNLKRTSLVTLSACETALAKVQGGDDLVGLSRGFIYAGTPSLIATLWKVDDASTALVMTQFYRNYRKGMSKPEALRQAQISLKADPHYQHPYYWAPFVMMGDWQ